MGEPITKTIKVSGRFNATKAEQAAANAQSTADRAHSRLDATKVHSAVGEVITLTDSAEAPLQGLKVFGRTEQRTTTGKNLLPNTATTQNIQGVLFTVNNDGSITATNKTSERSTMVVGAAVLPAGSYILSQGNITNADVCLYAKYTYDGVAKYADCYGASVSGSAGFTLSQETTVTVHIDVRDTDVTVNKTLYPMLRLASITDATYEPYTGGKPSPSPEYPQALESVGDGGTVTVTACGKNLFNYDAWKGIRINRGTAVWENNGVKLTATEDNCYTAYTANIVPVDARIPVQKGDVLTVSWDCESNISGEAGIFVNGESKVYKVVESAAKQLVYSVPDGTTFVTVRFGVSKAGNTIAFKNIMVERGSTATAFEPSKFQTLPISTPLGLPGIPVSQNGNYTDASGRQWICDEVDFEKGVYVQRVGRVVFDGTENWTPHNGGSFIRTTLTDAHIPGFDEVAYLYCSHFLARTRRAIVTGTEVGVGVASAIQISFYFGADYTVDMVKAFFLEQYTNGKPVTLLYRTTSTIEHTLTAKELAQYVKLRTHNPNTTIYNNAGAEMKVDYATPDTVLSTTGGAVANLKVPAPQTAIDAVPKYYVDNVDKKVETLKGIVKSFHSNIVQETSGELITVSDASDMELAGLRIFGKTEQKTTTGKSVLPFVSIRGFNSTLWTNGTVDGQAVVTIDASISSSGWATIGREFSAISESGTYVFSAYVYTQTATKCMITIFDSNYTEYGTNGYDLPAGWTRISTHSANLNTGTSYSFAVRVPGPALGADIDVSINRFMVEKGSVVTDYEPYTGGIPSPNPDYPQALESVGDGGSVTTTVCGKNLLDVSKFTNQIYSAEGVLTGSTNHKLFDYIPVKKGDVFTLSAAYKGTNVEYLRWALFDVNKLFISRYGGASKTETATFNISQDGYIRVFIAYGEYDVNTLQLESGSTATAYEPYTATTVTALTPNGLPGIPVTSGGNYTDPVTKQQWLCDEVDFEKGVYVQRIGVKIFDGTESFVATSVAGGHRYSLINNQNDAHKLLWRWETEQNIMCSHFGVLDKYYSTASRDAGTVSQYSGDLGIELSFKLADTDMATYAAEQYAMGNPLTVTYPIKHPTEHKLTEEELAQYAAMQSHYPNTTVFNDAGAKMDVKYIADTKIYIDNKFAELAAAIVGNA